MPISPSGTCGRPFSGTSVSRPGIRDQLPRAAGVGEVSTLRARRMLSLGVFKISPGPLQTGMRHFSRVEGQMAGNSGEDMGCDGSHASASAGGLIRADAAPSE